MKVEKNTLLAVRLFPSEAEALCSLEVCRESI